MKKLSSSSFSLFFTMFMNSVNVIILLSDDHHRLLQNYHQVTLPGGVNGPESIAFDCHGKGPYVGVSDGRILKWQGPLLGWIEFAITSPNRQRQLCDGSTNSGLEPICGRPLGLKFNPKTCQLYIADAYFGLLVVGASGGQALKLAASAEGVPFRFTNALDIDTNTGHVYFTDSSIVFQRREYLLVMGGDKTGRLLKYEPDRKRVTVMYKGLAFPNGVALSKDNAFLLVAEANTMRVLRFWLGNDGTPGFTGPEVFAQLGRFPDNIKRNPRGEFWVALNSARGVIKKVEMGTYGWFTEDPVGVKYDEMGEVVMTVDGNGGEALESVSEVEEHGGCLYMGSSIKPYVGVFNLV